MAPELTMIGFPPASKSDVTSGAVWENPVRALGTNAETADPAAIRYGQTRPPAVDPTWHCAPVGSRMEKGV
jgi:hypothetical protein